VAPRKALSRWERSAPPPPSDPLDSALSSSSALVRRQPVWLRVSEALAGVLLIAFLDWATGENLAFSVFYVIPLAFATWFVSARFGYVLAVVTAPTAWGYVDAANHWPHAVSPLGYWDVIVRFAFFAIIVTLLDRMQRAQRRVQAMAHIDPLTGVANWRAFEEHASVALAQIRRSGRPLTLAYVDLDDFKAVNDTFGHHEGDEVLRTVATAFEERLRTTDMVARLGGDEFALLLPETNVQAARRVLADAVQAVADAVSSRWSVSQTIGAVTLLQPPDSVDDMVRLADGLMYEAKNAGRRRLILREWPESPAT